MDAEQRIVVSDVQGMQSLAEDAYLCLQVVSWDEIRNQVGKVVACIAELFATHLAEKIIDYMRLLNDLLA